MKMFVPSSDLLNLMIESAMQKCNGDILQAKIKAGPAANLKQLQERGLAGEPKSFNGRPRTAG